MTTTKTRLWTVDEYHRMIEVGFLTTDDRVELLEGQIITDSRQQYQSPDFCHPQNKTW